jgi:uncharacterized membrane protein YfcA
VLSFYSEIALAALIAGTLDTVVGFGGVLLLLPILMMTTGNKDGIVFAAMIPLGWNIPRVILLREKINWRATLLFAIGIIPGSILGAAYLDVVDQQVLKTVVGIILILFGAYYVLRLYIDLPGPRGVKGWIFPIAGFISAALAGLMGAGNGPLQTGALSASDLSVREITATNGALGAITALSRLAGYGAQGMLREDMVPIAVVGFVFAFGGAYLGIRLSSRAKNSTLELLVGLAIILAGVKLIF